MSEQQQPHLPAPPPTPAAWTGGPPEPARRRPRGLLVGALIAVLALVAGLAVIGGRESPATARPLALSFTPGDRETYRLHVTMDGTVGAGEILPGTPIEMDLTEVVTWEVIEVDDEGVATITVTVEELSGSFNGVEVPSDVSQLPSFEMHVAPDGRIIEAGGLSFAGADVSGGASFPGMGQMTPLLPDHPVAPGDEWTTRFSQEIPFARGTISYEARSTFERYEELNGGRAAVIATEMTVPMDLEIRFDELLAAIGDGERMPTGAGGLEDATITYGGGGSVRQTAWVDLEAEELLRARSSGTFDVTMTFAGLEVFEGQELTFAGRFTQELSRR